MGDEVLLAVGREPLTGPLALDKAGVKLDEKDRYIAVDDFQNTSAEGVYALGDVCGNVELTPMAIAAGRRLADRLFAGVNGKADYDDVPTVVFSHPPIGTVGLTEKQAVEKYGEQNVKVWTSTFVNLWYGPMPIDPSDKPRTRFISHQHYNNISLGMITQFLQPTFYVFKRGMFRNII